MLLKVLFWFGLGFGLWQVLGFGKLWEVVARSVGGGGGGVGKKDRAASRAGFYTIPGTGLDDFQSLQAIRKTWSRCSRWGRLGKVVIKCECDGDCG